MKRKVVVTGLGIVTPLGLDLEESWRKALAGVSAIGRLAAAGAERFPIQMVGAVSNDDMEKIKSGFSHEADRCPTEPLQEGGVGARGQMHFRTVVREAAWQPFWERKRP